MRNSTVSCDVVIFVPHFSFIFLGLYGTNNDQVDEEIFAKVSFIFSYRNLCCLLCATVSSLFEHKARASCNILATYIILHAVVFGLARNAISNCCLML